MITLVVQGLGGPSQRTPSGRLSVCLSRCKPLRLITEGCFFSVRRSRGIPRAEASPSSTPSQLCTTRRAEWQRTSQAEAPTSGTLMGNYPLVGDRGSPGLTITFDLPKAIPLVEARGSDFIPTAEDANGKPTNCGLFQCQHAWRTGPGDKDGFPMRSASSPYESARDHLRGSASSSSATFGRQEVKNLPVGKENAAACR